MAVGKRQKHKVHPRYHASTHKKPLSPAEEFIPDKKTLDIMKEIGITQEPTAQKEPLIIHKPSSQEQKKHLDHPLLKSTLIILLVILLSVAMYIHYANQKSMRIHFIDVGHGDSIFVQLPDGKNMLIDTGYYDQGTKVVEYLKAQNISRIDALVITHFDEDHAGGLDKVLNNFVVTKFYDNGKADYSFRSRNKVSADTPVQLDPAVDITLLTPYTADAYNEGNNDNSLVTKITYGKTSFLLMGDCMSVCESIIMDRVGDVDVMKLGHHGSQNTTDVFFLDRTKPEMVIISTGDYDRFGHPAPSTLQELEKRGITIKRTDRDHDIVIESNAKRYWLIGK